MADSKKTYVLKTDRGLYAGRDDEGEVCEVPDVVDAEHFDTKREAYRIWEEDWFDFNDIKVVPVKKVAPVDVKAAMIAAVREFSLFTRDSSNTWDQDVVKFCERIQSGSFTP